MTVVDVNTGKFVGSGGNLEQTVTRNNMEAAEEIVRQLRLRDIGGIIVIDFIDMVLESNRDLVLRRLTECLGRDRTKHQVAEVTSLGLVQMTRKRVGQGLLEVFSEPCEHCRGRGVLVHLDPVDDKKRSGGNGGGTPGGGNGGGSGRNRDRDRTDAGGNGRGEGGNGRGDQPRRDAAESAPAVVAEVPVTDESGAESGAGSVELAEQTAGEGRSGRRSRGRRGRGQSGEARAAEDAAVLAGARDDAPAAEDDVLPAGETAAEVVEAAEAPVEAPVVEAPVVEAPVEAPVVEAPVEEPTPDTVLAAEIAGTPGDLAEEGPVAEQPPAEEAQPEPAVVVAPEPVAQPVAEDTPPVARPRRRRAASRPAGPPA